MNDYLGAFPVDASDHPRFGNFTSTDWAMFFISRFGGIETEDHKAWVIDQVARILKGTPVILLERRWENGHTEFDYLLGDPSAEYLDWVERQKGETYEDKSRQYDWNEGISP